MTLQPASRAPSTDMILYSRGFTHLANENNQDGHYGQAIFDDGPTIVLTRT